MKMFVLLLREAANRKLLSFLAPRAKRRQRGRTRNRVEKVFLRMTDKVISAEVPEKTSSIGP